MSDKNSKEHTGHSALHRLFFMYGAPPSGPCRKRLLPFRAQCSCGSNSFTWGVAPRAVLQAWSAAFSYCCLTRSEQVVQYAPVPGRGGVGRPGGVTFYRSNSFPRFSVVQILRISPCGPLRAICAARAVQPCGAANPTHPDLPLLRTGFAGAFGLLPTGSLGTGRSVGNRAIRNIDYFGKEVKIR